MPRYSAQFRKMILKKLMPPENKAALTLAKEYNLSVATIYGWRVKMLEVSPTVKTNFLTV